MYSQLSQTQTGQDEIAAATSRAGRIRRRAGKTVAVLGVCFAATAAGTLSDASARPQETARPVHVSAQQFQREMTALTNVGFVATSCEVGGTRMTDYNTNQSVLLSW